MIPAGYRRLKAQSAQARDQLPPFDGTNGGHSDDFVDFDPVAVNVGNRGVIGDAEEQPSFQCAFQFFPAALERMGVGPNTGDRRYFAVKRAVVLNDFVTSLSHGGPDVRSQHAYILSLQHLETDGLRQAAIRTSRL